jgi:hypothetical protein
MAAKSSALIIFYRNSSRFLTRSVNVLGSKRFNLSLILVPYISFVEIYFIDILNELLTFKIISSKNFVHYISGYVIKKIIKLFRLSGLLVRSNR